MNRFLMTAFAALLLGIPAAAVTIPASAADTAPVATNNAPATGDKTPAAAADKAPAPSGDLVKQRLDIEALSNKQIDMAEKFKENADEAKADKARYDQLEKESKRQEREHATLEAQRAQVKKACVGIIPEGTLIEATNSCNEINGPFQQNIAIHNAAIAKSAVDYKELDAKEKKRAAEAQKLQTEDADQRAQLYSMKRKLLIAIKNACIPTCSDQAPNRVNGCIQGCWERARLKRQLPVLPGEKLPPVVPDVPGTAAETPAPPAPPPPPADPGDPLAGAPRQPQ